MYLFSWPMTQLYHPIKPRCACVIELVCDPFGANSLHLMSSIPYYAKFTSYINFSFLWKGQLPQAWLLCIHAQACISSSKVYCLVPQMHHPTLI